MLLSSLSAVSSAASTSSRPLKASASPTTPVPGAVSAFATGIGAIGFEGVRAPSFELENLVGAVPRVRGTSPTGVGLEQVLEQGGRAPKAGLEGLHNRYGSPDRIDELAQLASVAQQVRLQSQRNEADIRPVVKEVSEEALRMLEAYINRTDELSSWSTEMLAQTMSSVADGMPVSGAPVSASKIRSVDLPGLSLAGPDPLLEAAEHAVENQLRELQSRRAAAEKVMDAVGAFEVRGTLYDQRL